MRTRFKLDNYDSEWREAGPSSLAEYTNLPPGSYQFRLEAVNRDGIWNRSGSSLRIIIPPRLWERS